MFEDGERVAALRAHSWKQHSVKHRDNLTDFFSPGWTDVCCFLCLLERRGDLKADNKAFGCLDSSAVLRVSPALDLNLGWMQARRGQPECLESHISWEPSQPVTFIMLPARWHQPV